ncbi:MAG: 50S ribosomal protein L28 [Candidatus Magasanikbacteria bacterium]|nr:50S ribosomal protein L28 [Candidatus Magasanikbacteria bacterium]
MARRCERCGRGPIKGASRSHSRVKTKRRLYPNLQWKTLDGRRTKICTSCLKTMSKVKK